MKKLIYSMIAMLAMGLGFTACSDDDGDDADYSYVTTPEIAAEGTYTGMFTRIQTNSSTAQPESGEGIVAVIANDTLTNIATVVVDCEALGLTGDKNFVAVNMTYANDKINFFNQSGEIAMKYVTGHITNDGLLSLTFDISIRSGRSTKPYRFTFEGVMSSLVEGDTAE